MPDPTAVLVNRQERDKWRHRVSLLQAQLGRVRLERHELERRLARLRRELSRVTQLTRTARAAVLPAGRRGVIDGRRPPSFL